MPWFAGVERNEIDWRPTIDTDKCVKCGMCMNCGKNVFDWDPDGKAIVHNPLACVVGCTACANLCLGKAISFPPIEQLRTLFRTKKVWTAVKRQLIDEGKIPAKHHELKEELSNN
jgi:NAD-dependent dihydropyrimidine dehydrogenase PreA subunit